MLSRLVSAFLVCILLSVSMLTVHAEEPTPAPSNLSAQSAILTDGNGNPLFKKNASERMGPASTTKLMTAIVTIENANASVDEMDIIDEPSAEDDIIED